MEKRLTGPLLGIVTINYLNWQDTVEMIKSLQRQSFQSFHMVIVDNHSANNSFQRLSELYSDNQQITLLETSDNLGFAKANNLGISFLKKNYDLYKIFIVNNDLLFQDDTYLSKLMHFKYESNIGAVGTNILAGQNLQQNPIFERTNLFRLLEQNWDFLFFPIFHSRYNVFRKISQFLRQSRPEKGDYVRDNIFFLHGSAILLTENYLKWSKGFYPKTFLYFEENILKIIFDKASLKMAFIPIAGVYHKEDQSSKLAKQDESFKIRLLSDNSRKAIFLKLLPAFFIKRIMSDN
ncbi:glycosyltransferase family 2 protein [Oenococcus sp. UCMA 16435]|nr:glycosyltransferase family 2 protein [Oenococcus sp. UCMA 16435]MDI4583833.1 glycosyltransferase [Oenococcus sp. UCMA 14587]